MDNTINSLVSQAVGGVSDQQIRDFLAANPTPDQLASAMKQYNVSPDQVFNAAGVGQGGTLKVGNTYFQPDYQVLGSGEDQQIGPLQNIYSYTEDQNKVGGTYNQYDPSGQLQRVGTQQKVDNNMLPFLLAAGGMALGLPGLGEGTSLSSLGTVGSDLAGLSGIPAGAGALTAAEQAALYGGAGLGGASAIGSDLAGLSGIPAGTGALTAAEQAALYGTGGGVMGALGGTPAMGGGLTAAGLGGLTGAMSTLGGDAALGAGLGSTVGSSLGGTLGATNSLLGGAALGSTLGSLGSTVGGSLLGSTLGSTLGNVAGSTLGSTLGSGLTSALGTSLGTGLGLSALGSGLGSLANQSGISDARNLINQYGTQAAGALTGAYQNAQNLNAANRTDLANIYGNTTGNLQNLYNQQVGYQQPYQNIGNQGATGLAANKDYLTHQFDKNDLNAQLAPNYEFMLNQGQMANQRAANMGGGALGGNALQGLQKYTQDYAGNAYQQAFNNYNTQRNNIYNSLAGMAGIGQTSAGQLANLGSNYGSNLAGLSSNYGGNLTTGYGQGIGAANAYGLNTAGLATGIGSALASNATQQGANTAGLLSNLGNTALLGSLLKVA